MSLHIGAMFPAPDTLNNLEEGKFVLSNLAAKRAKQLKEGAPPLVRVDSNHPLTVALAEIAAGKIKPIVGAELVDETLDTGDGLPVLDDQALPAELGILLPALDETEAELVSQIVEMGDVDGDEANGDDDSDGAASLTDLLEDADADILPAEGEEATLSLSDIADQENLDEEEESDSV
jgi:DNA-directed RNA polymerase subunit omega